MADPTIAARSVAAITGYTRIDGVVPGVRGQRAFPTRERGVLDPFVMLDHIGPEVLADDFFVDGVMHPHRGFETLTMMFEGVMHHVDSTGFREELPTGSTQNMRAGRGIRHGGSMEADPETNVFHEVQLWVTTPAAQKMDAPAISSALRTDKPTIERDGVRIEVITGELHGLTSPLSTTQPTRVLHVTSTAGGRFELDDVPSGWVAAVYVLRGAIECGRSSGAQFDLVTFGDDGERLEIGLRPGSEMLVLTGEPTGEPIAMGGPWVMNTRAELDRADADFAAGLF